jgi:hypothetical protein
VISITGTVDLVPHLDGPHYCAMLTAMAIHEIHGVDVLKYEISLAAPVYGADGKASAESAGES